MSFLRWHDGWGIQSQSFYKFNRWDPKVLKNFCPPLANVQGTFFLFDTNKLPACLSIEHSYFYTYLSTKGQMIMRFKLAAPLYEELFQSSLWQPATNPRHLFLTYPLLQDSEWGLTKIIACNWCILLQKYFKKMFKNSQINNTSRSHCLRGKIFPFPFWQHQSYVSAVHFDNVLDPPITKFWQQIVQFKLCSYYNWSNHPSGHGN